MLCRFATSLPQLLCLRALYGVAVGVSMHSSPPYLAETCPAPVRGLVFCAKEGMIVAGILKGYMVSPPGSTNRLRHARLVMLEHCCNVICCCPAALGRCFCACVCFSSVALC